MNAVVQHEPLSVVASMASTYGMDRRAFEATLRATILPKDATNEQAAAFLLVAKQHNLNPFTKEIFAFPSRGGIQPIVSVDGWMKLINSHPQFDGMDFKDTLDDKGTLISVTCRIHRKDRSHPVEVTEYMCECRRNTDTWNHWPARMLRHKSAIQAARYAFGFAGIMEPDEVERMADVPEAPTVEVQLIDKRKERHDEAVEQYQDSITVIKEAIAAWDQDSENTDALYTVAETWGGIPQVAQVDLWLAPTKGGIFTTHERDVIKNKLPKEPQA